MSTSKKVAIISRESDSKSLDIRLIEEELLRRGIEVETLTRLFRKSVSLKSLGYIGHMMKQEKAIIDADVVLLDTYCIPASMLPHRKGTTVIQMWHALSAIKQFGWQTVGKENGSSEKVARIMHMHDRYDKVLCSSDVTAQYFCEGFNVSPDKIVKIGLPRIDYILKEDKKTEERLRSRFGRISTRPAILYAPTFRGGKTVDVRSLAEAVDLDNYTLLVRLHPLDRDESSRVDMPGVIYTDSYNSYDLLRVSDAVITDYSSLAVEASLTGKPLYFYTYDEDDYRAKTGLNMDFREEPVSKYVFQDARELCKVLESGEYDYDALAAFRDKYIDVDTDNCTGRLADYIESLLG